MSIAIVTKLLEWMGLDLFLSVSMLCSRPFVHDRYIHLVHMSLDDFVMNLGLDFDLMGIALILMLPIYCLVMELI